jgi:hypothetical protein
MLPSILGPAAHGPLAPDNAYYRARLTAITPQPSDITANPQTEWVEISYTGAGEAIIYGYQHEPYVRITPERTLGMRCTQANGGGMGERWVASRAARLWVGRAVWSRSGPGTGSTRSPRLDPVEAGEPPSSSPERHRRGRSSQDRLQTPL